ncbi:hypothetical protein ACJQWK_02006 [Exserohilum turcicum]
MTAHDTLAADACRDDGLHSPPHSRLPRSLWPGQCCIRRTRPFAQPRARQLCFSVTNSPLSDINLGRYQALHLARSVRALPIHMVTHSPPMRPRFSLRSASSALL